MHESREALLLEYYFFKLKSLFEVSMERIIMEREYYYGFYLDVRMSNDSFLWFMGQM